MTNQRSRIRMSPAEVDPFLHEQRTLSMASFVPDGAIHLVAIWYGLVEGSIGVETKAKSQKIQNLRRNPRVTVLIESGSTYGELQGVEIIGRAEIIDTPCSRMRELCASVIRSGGADHARPRRHRRAPGPDRQLGPHKLAK